MGVLEESTGKKSRKRKLAQAVLGTIAVTGILAVGLLAPNVIGAMAKFGMIPRKRDRELIKRTRESLIKRGLLERDGNNFLRITSQGQIQLARSQEYTPDRKPKRWDGKWRLLIFDIPEMKRNDRQKIRNTLIAWGFARLQNSVWIYPYKCEDLATLLKADMRIGKQLLYLIVDELEYDAPWREHFGLPS